MSDPKEPYFFEAEFERGLAFYREKYFSHWEGEARIGDARHRNLYLPYVPDRILEISPDAHLIAILRDPVERAFSNWKHWRTRDRESLGFADAVAVDLDRLAEAAAHPDAPFPETDYAAAIAADGSGYGLHRTYVDTGYYAEQLERYFERFDRARVSVMFFEEFVASQAEHLQRLRAFLGLDGSWSPSNAQRATNAGHSATYRRIARAARKSGVSRLMPASVIRAAGRAVGRMAPPPACDKETRALLGEHFREPNLRLEALLGRTLPW